MTSLAFLLALSLAAPEAAVNREVFEVRFVILGLPVAGPATLTGERMARFGEAILLTGPLEAKWGAESLRSDGALLLLDGKPLSFEATSAGPTSGLRVVASPVVAVPTSEDAVLKFGTAENTQYFSRDADGRFSLKQVPVTPQVELHIKLDQQMGGDAIGADLSYRLVTLGPRARMEGVDLDVGQPSFQEESGTSRLQTKLGTWSLLIPKAQPSSPFAVLVRVARRAR
jgi:hypothetical protein